MAKVYLNDLSSANSSKMLTELDTIKEDISKLYSNINSFNSQSTTELIGSGYDAVRAKMTLYADELNKLQMICENLSSCIKAANNTMINFMEGYSELDDSKIPEVENAIKTAESYLAWLESTSPEVGPDGTVTYVKNGSDAEISACMAKIAALKELLEKLKALSPTDKSAFSGIDAVKSDIVSFANAIIGLKLPNFDGTFPKDEESFIAKSLSSATGSRNYYSFNQKDPRWQNSGYRSVDGQDIAVGGCGPCSVAAALATIMGDDSINPYTVGSIMGQNGWNNYGGNFVPNMASYYGLDCDPNFAANSNRQQSMINLLENGGSVIVGYKGGGHYVAVVGYDEDKNEFIVADSYPSVAGYNDNLYQIGYEELRRNTQNLESGIYGSLWEAVAPKGMTVEEATRGKSYQI